MQDVFHTFNTLKDHLYICFNSLIKSLEDYHICFKFMLVNRFNNVLLLREKRKIIFLRISFQITNERFN